MWKQGCAPYHPNIQGCMALIDKIGGIDPHELVDFLIESKRILQRDVKQRLRDNFGPTTQDIGGKEDFDLHQEIVEQLKAVRNLRKSVIDPAGNLVMGVRDAKEALSSATSLLNLLTKIQGDVYNQDRIRTIQKTTIEVLKEVDPEVHARFMELLKVRLGVE